MKRKSRVGKRDKNLLYSNLIFNFDISKTVKKFTLNAINSYIVPCKHLENINKIEKKVRNRINYLENSCMNWQIIYYYYCYHNYYHYYDVVKIVKFYYSDNVGGVTLTRLEVRVSQIRIRPSSEPATTN